jgi:hypothetical protein
MTAWQVVIEILKTVGVGALAGVVVGAGTTRSQKKREALQAIKAANYREMVSDYRRLTAQLKRIEREARTALSVATLNVRAQQAGPVHPSLAGMLNERLISGTERLDQAVEALDECFANMIVHRSETTFHSQSENLEWEAGLLSIEIALMSDCCTADRLQAASDSLTRFTNLTGILALTWDEWKIQAEREAAGERPEPRFRAARIYLNRRM